MWIDDFFLYVMTDVNSCSAAYFFDLLYFFGEGGGIGVVH